MKSRINEDGSRLLGVLSAIFSPIIIIAMIIFGIIYAREGVFVIGQDLEHKVYIICLGLIVMILSSLYNSVASSILIKMVKELKDKIEEKDDENARLLRDLGDSLSILLDVFLRKSKTFEEALIEIKDISRRNNLGGE